MRPPPGDSVEAREADIRDIAEQTVPGQPLDRLVSLVPFKSQNVEAFKSVMADQYDPIDLQYWTEAALLAEAGVNCVVYGPGDISRAHQPNEFVSKTHLAEAIHVYARALEN